MIPLMTCRLFGDTPVPEPIMSDRQTHKFTQSNFPLKVIWWHRLQNDGHFVQASLY